MQADGLMSIGTGETAKCMNYLKQMLASPLGSLKHIKHVAPFTLIGFDLACFGTGVNFTAFVWVI